MSLRLAAILLIVLGALTIVSPAITYTTQEPVIDIGPIEVTAEEKKRVPLPSIHGGVSLAVGLGLLVMGRKRSGSGQSP